MNNNTKRINWLLAIGATLIYLAGISFFISDIANDALKVLVNTIISISLIAITFGVEDGFKIEGIGKYSFILGFISFISTFIFIGENDMLGSYFSLSGDGVFLYYTFLFILGAIFSYICSIRYKDYIFKHLLYSSLLASLFTLMSHFSSNLYANLSICGIIILFLNFANINTDISKFARYTSIIYTLMTCSYIAITSNIDKYLLFIWIIIIINAINLFITMYKDSRPAMHILSILIYIYNAVIITKIGSIGIYILLIALILAIFELLLNYFKVIKNKNMQIFLKIFINLAYINLFSIVSKNVLEFSILTAIVFGTSFVNSYLYRHDEVEYNIIPLKLYYVIATMMMIINTYVIKVDQIINYIILDFVYLFVIYFTKNDKHKLICTVLTLFFSYLMLNYRHITPTYYVISGLICLLNYYIVILKTKEQTSIKGRIYYGLLLLMLLSSLNHVTLNSSKYIISSLLFGLLSFLTYNDRVGFAITLPALFISLGQYINTLTVTESTKSLLLNINNFACISLWINNLKIDVNTKVNTLSIILLILSIIALNSSYVLDTLLVIIVSVVMIYIGLKNKEYKRLHDFGIAIVILSLLDLTSLLGEAKTFIYLLVVGIGIIYFVIRLASKSIKNVEKEEVSIPELKEDKKENKKQTKTDKYCSKCGNKLNGNEKFCGKCGNKIK